MSDIVLRESVKMVKDEEEIEDICCKAKRIAYSSVARTLNPSGRGKPYV